MTLHLFIYLFIFYCSNKMKTVLVIAIIACLFVVGLAQSQECMNQATNLASCLSMLTSGGSTFCNDCASRLISYYNECLNGAGVDAVRTSKFTE